MSCEVCVIDLDDGKSRNVCWDPSTLDDEFEVLIESQLRQEFAVSDEAWVDLIDLNNSALISINKDNLLNVKSSLCLCLSSKSVLLAPIKRNEIFEVIFHQKVIGITVHESNDTVRVHQFKCKYDGSMGEAQACGKIQTNDIIYKVSGQRAIGRPCGYVLQMLQTQKRPLSIQFFRPFCRKGLFAVEFKSVNMNMVVNADEEHVLVTELPMAYPNVIGYAEAHGVRTSDVIHAIDGEIIKGSEEYSRAVCLLSRPKRPMVVVFRRSRALMLTQEKLNGCEVSSTPSGTSDTFLPRFSFASTVAPSPQQASRNTLFSRRGSRCSVMSSARGEAMLVEDMLQYCESLAFEDMVTPEEASILKEMVISTRPDLLCAIRRRNRNAVIAIVRSPAMRLWDHLLKTRESILLAGPVLSKKKKRYHLLLSDHQRLLLVDKETNLLDDEIMCSHIVTVSSKSGSCELHISTAKHEYALVDNFVGVMVWVRAILPFVCTQGYLKVSTSRRLFSSKRRYFILRKKQLTGYKKEQQIHSPDAKSSTISLKGACMDIVDPKGFIFTISTPEFLQAGKKLIFTAPSGREFNKWIVALDFISKSSSNDGFFDRE
uniref:Uncharacterized protein AlNc14C296G10305 n=1 Tax=Albugo laibachii Nc14 TaxID=890382 RepID=F0WVH0_9STRA|nr:conserved hypothetical protein [Albugo laibachii Nc14]|eukprot:CCA25411.1 conserved hypothetical protein [Albugo laibachii Nc14]